jgi:polyphosphate glucokinase
MNSRDHLKRCSLFNLKLTQQNIRFIRSEAEKLVMDKLVMDKTVVEKTSFTDEQQKQPHRPPSAIKTLAVDIGGSGIKVLVIDEIGQPLGARDRVKTPRPATPEAVVKAIEALASQKEAFDRISVGFPGVVRRGVIYTAVNLHESWREYDLAGQLTTQLGKPVRVANDADMQGMGAISGQGVELVITLGTGFGTALFTNGLLVPNLEFGHQRFRKGETYEQQLGRAALKKVGQKAWNSRLLKAISALESGFNYDRLYLGGGEVGQVDVALPSNVTIVSNLLGLMGGIKLWQ